MTNEEIDDRILRLATSDSNDEEIDGLTEIIRELIAERQNGLSKFSSEPPGYKMQPNDVVFQLVWDDVTNTAHETQGKDFINPKTLSSEEMHTFRKCLEAGLGSWSEVVQIALMAATVGREQS